MGPMSDFFSLLQIIQIKHFAIENSLWLKFLWDILHLEADIVLF